MKKLVLVSTVAAALFMAGCSSKSPEVDMSADANKANQGVISAAERLNSLQAQVQNVYFDFDKFSIRPDMQSVINQNASIFNQAGNYKVMVEGNCDEWGSDEYNYALGVKRAKAAKDALIAQGIAADRIEITSNGESKPVCTEKTKSCDAQNRRDEFRLLP
ncbi:MAG: OmpA family protein [Campylobacter sp.]|jgi:peptidoglycan-associated lipoprotein|uniref:Peptidoglycan-associated lipoprotein n=1 Tax=Campylobacter devanensis TaxID=3161138 RepID=A0A1X9STQ7_9BACT|nr:MULTISPECIES: OmpA family protein [Campylobacter]MEE3694502.1 OmpA family protein [Campylobacter sp. CLAX-22107-21]ARQ99592.1 Tol-Pal system peptidoglycan-associated lipoprotein [Campylobacter lanienae]MBO7155384.1 OmpA family protein [Campylobacter sp.]MBP3676427.1 OmpA family protein [Campylobacter sp.]MBR2149114.1 OmpA family protein [Campylobacter sp.]